MDEHVNTTDDPLRSDKNLVNFGPATSAFWHWTNYTLGVATHFYLIIFARWRLQFIQMPRAWFAMARLRAGRTHAGLCHTYLVCKC